MNKHILIAEDDPAERRLIADAFRAVDPAIEITAVGTAREVIDYMSGDGVYDLSFALVDLGLPDGGQEMIGQLSDDPGTRMLPVVVFSGTTDPDAVIACYQAGASAFVSKPSDPDGYRKIAQTMSDFWLDINVTAKPEVSLF